MRCNRIIVEALKELVGAKKSESEPSLKPPKEWWDRMYKDVSSKNPSYSEDQIKNTLGDIWYHQLTKSKRSEIRQRYGKKYG